MRFLTSIQKIYDNAPVDLRRRLITIFIFLAFLNAFVWIETLLTLQQYPAFLGLITLAYGLGLRHAVDADHIAAIDNTTRKLMQEGKQPVSVGFFFSLGHATIVIILSVLLAISTTFVTSNLPAIAETGGLVGASISGLFLLVIGIINFIVFIDIVKTWRKVIKNPGKKGISIKQHLYTKGILTRLLKPFLKTVSKSWHMYFVGFLFGLGFDTATEVGLLSIAAATGVSGMPMGTILLLPLAFTAGMCLIDTIDGVLMLGAYGWAYIKPIRKLYYNMTITAISVIVAFFIGSIETMQVIFSQFKLQGKPFDVINNIAFGNLGYIIIGIFVACWLLSLIIYKVKNYDLIEG